MWENIGQKLLLVSGHKVLVIYFVQECVTSSQMQL